MTLLQFLVLWLVVSLPAGIVVGRLLRGRADDVSSEAS